MVERDQGVDAHVELLERTSVLANERTYAAWIRTGLAALVTGLGMEKLLVGIIPFFWIRLTSMVMIVLSVAFFILASWRYDHVSSRMVSVRVSGAPKSVMHFISILLSVVSLAAGIGLWIINK